MKACISLLGDPFKPFAQDLKLVEKSSTIDEWLEENEVSFNHPTICLRNGEPVLRKDWGTAIADQDVILFLAVPQGGGDGGSNPLQIVAMFAILAVAMFVIGPAIAAGTGGLSSTAAGGMTGFSTSAGAAMQGVAAGQMAVTGLAAKVGMIAFVGVGNMVLQRIFAPDMPDSSLPTSTYSLTSRGNQARLEQPIPSIYGRLQIFPDIAAQPYSEHSTADGQTLYQLFCIGQGSYEIEDIRVGDNTVTPIADADEVEYQIVNPGEQVTLFPANVVTSGAVAGLDLWAFNVAEQDSSDTSQYPFGIEGINGESIWTGPFPVTETLDPVTEIHLDFQFPGGLSAKTSKGKAYGHGAGLRLEAREIGTPNTFNDDDRPLEESIINHAGGTTSALKMTVGDDGSFIDPEWRDPDRVWAADGNSNWPKKPTSDELAALADSNAATRPNVGDPRPDYRTSGLSTGQKVWIYFSQDHGLCSRRAPAGFESENWVDPHDWHAGYPSTQRGTPAPPPSQNPLYPPTEEFQHIELHNVESDTDNSTTIGTLKGIPIKKFNKVHRFFRVGPRYGYIIIPRESAASSGTNLGGTGTTISRFYTMEYPYKLDAKLKHFKGQMHNHEGVTTHYYGHEKKPFTRTHKYRVSDFTEQWVGKTSTTVAQKKFKKSGRFQVRISRLLWGEYTRGFGYRVQEKILWVGLKGMIPSTKSYGDVTLLAMKMRASNQVNASTNTKVNCIVTRKLRRYLPSRAGTNIINNGLRLEDEETPWNYVRVTTSAAHDLDVGDKITIAGATTFSGIPASYLNREHLVVEVNSSTVFRIKLVNSESNSYKGNNVINLAHGVVSSVSGTDIGINVDNSATLPSNMGGLSFRNTSKPGWRRIQFPRRNGLFGGKSESISKTDLRPRVSVDHDSGIVTLDIGPPYVIDGGDIERTDTATDLLKGGDNFIIRGLMSQEVDPTGIQLHAWERFDFVGSLGNEYHVIEKQVAAYDMEGHDNTAHSKAKFVQFRMRNLQRRGTKKAKLDPPTMRKEYTQGMAYAGTFVSQGETSKEERRTGLCVGSGTGWLTFNNIAGNSLVGGTIYFTGANAGISAAITKVYSNTLLTVSFDAGSFPPVNIPVQGYRIEYGPNITRRYAFADSFTIEQERLWKVAGSSAGSLTISSSVGSYTENGETINRIEIDDHVEVVMGPDLTPGSDVNGGGSGMSWSVPTGQFIEPGDTYTDPLDGTTHEYSGGTRSPAWAILDIATAKYGGKMSVTDANGDPDSTYVDLDALYQLDQLWRGNDPNLADSQNAPRNAAAGGTPDTFDGIFDTRQTLIQAVNAVAQVGRSMAQFPQGQLTLVRDEYRSTSSAVFSERNITPGSLSIAHRYPGEEEPDSVVIEYLDEGNWRMQEVPAYLVTGYVGGVLVESCSGGTGSNLGECLADGGTWAQQFECDDASVGGQVYQGVADADGDINYSLLKREGGSAEAFTDDLVGAYIEIFKSRDGSDFGQSFSIVAKRVVIECIDEDTLKVAPEIPIGPDRRGTCSLDGGVLDEESAFGNTECVNNGGTWTENASSAFTHTLYFYKLEKALNKNPERVRMIGATNRTTAWREGIHRVAMRRYQRTHMTIETELEGYIPSFGDRVTLSALTPDWGQSGDVLNYETAGSNTTLTLSTPVMFKEATLGGSFTTLQWTDADSTTFSPFTTEAGSARIIVSEEDHGHLLDDRVVFEGVAASIGGLAASKFNGTVAGADPNEVFTNTHAVAEIIDRDTWAFYMDTEATASEANAGGSTAKVRPAMSSTERLLNIAFRKDDGSLLGPMVFTKSPSNEKQGNIVTASLGSFVLSNNPSGDREFTQYVIGRGGAWSKACRIVGIAPRGGARIEVTLTQDGGRDVYDADGTFETPSEIPTDTLAPPSPPGPAIPQVKTFDQVTKLWVVGSSVTASLGGTTQDIIATIEWIEAPGAHVYTVKYRQAYGAKWLSARTGETSAEVSVSAGPLYVKVYARGGGLRGPASNFRGIVSPPYEDVTGQWVYPVPTADDIPGAVTPVRTTGSGLGLDPEANRGDPGATDYITLSEHLSGEKDSINTEFTTQRPVSQQERNEIRYGSVPLTTLKQQCVKRLQADGGGAIYGQGALAGKFGATLGINTDYINPLDVGIGDKISIRHAHGLYDLSGTSTGVNGTVYAGATEITVTGGSGTVNVGDYIAVAVDEVLLVVDSPGSVSSGDIITIDAPAFNAATGQPILGFTPYVTGKEFAREHTITDVTLQPINGGPERTVGSIQFTITDLEYTEQIPVTAGPQNIRINSVGSDPISVSAGSNEVSLSLGGLLQSWAVKESMGGTNRLFESGQNDRYVQLSKIHQAGRIRTLGPSTSALGGSYGQVFTGRPYIRINDPRHDMVCGDVITTNLPQSNVSGLLVHNYCPHAVEAASSDYYFYVPHCDEISVSANATTNEFSYDMDTIRAMAGNNVNLIANGNTVWLDIPYEGGFSYSSNDFKRYDTGTHFVDGDVVRLFGTGTVLTPQIPAGVDDDTSYIVTDLGFSGNPVTDGPDRFKLAAVSDGSVVNLGAGSNAGETVYFYKAADRPCGDGLDAGKVYYIVNHDRAGRTFQLSESSGGSAITFSNDATVNFWRTSVAGSNTTTSGGVAGEIIANGDGTIGGISVDKINGTHAMTIGHGGGSFIVDGSPGTSDVSAGGDDVGVRFEATVMVYTSPSQGEYAILDDVYAANANFPDKDTQARSYVKVGLAPDEGEALTISYSPRY